MPELTPEGGAGTAPAGEHEAVGLSESSAAVDRTTFTQEDVDRIVTERLRRERQRLEKAVRDEFEARIAELQVARDEAQRARDEAAALSAAVRNAERRALIAECLLDRGINLPSPYLALIEGDDRDSIAASIQAVYERWEADAGRFARPQVNIGTPTRVAPQQTSPPTAVDGALAERMRRGDPEAFREYAAVRRR